MQLVGIDGCRGGWVCASAECDLTAVIFTIQQDLTEVFSDAVRDRDIVVIDVPIGLPSHEPRGCDLAARQYLPVSKKSSVFPAPCRATLAADNYVEACKLNRRASGKAISKQLWGILKKIRDVDRLMSCPMQKMIREAHPEVTFAALGDRADPLPKKSGQHGQNKRIELIQSSIPFMDCSVIQKHRSRLGAGKASLDDLIDALACLITAARILNGTACTLPADPARNARGLRMEIVV